MWLNIKNFRLPEGLSHKFMGPYAGPFKVLEKKFSDTYKLELPKNLRVYPTFHMSLLKPVSRDASKPNRENNSKPPPDLVHNEPEFEVEAVLKSRQLRGREREYLVKWKGYHLIEASWVNESSLILHPKQTTKWLVYIREHPWLLGQAMGTLDHKTHHGLDSGEATTFPHIVYSVTLH